MWEVSGQQSGMDDSPVGVEVDQGEEEPERHQQEEYRLESGEPRLHHVSCVSHVGLTPRSFRSKVGFL